MGEVFLAQHATIEKNVAIKVLLAERAEQPTQKARFLNEARATAKIRHPNVIDITDFGESDDGRAFFVMDYLQGEDLKRFCRRKHVVPWRETEPILLQICSGLGAAHKLGIIHRDLKPDNVFLINHHGIPNFVKILDFGLAKLLNEPDAKRLTKNGIIVGTPAFLSPEQIKGDPVDNRADIYALGLILYRMLCGALPFKAKTVVEMLRKQLMERPLPPSTIAPDAPIPAEAEHVALKALEKNPEDRYQSTEELGRAIAAVSANNLAGAVQIAVPSQLEIVEAGDGENAIALGNARPPRDVTGPHIPLQRGTGPNTPTVIDGPAALSASGQQPVFELVDPDARSNDGVITPADAADSFRSQLLSRPEEASEQLRREQISEQRQLPVGLILLVSIVLGAVVVAIFLLK